MIGVGERGAERVDIRPVSGYGGHGGSAGGDTHIHLEGATFTSRELARALVSDMARELDWHRRFGTG